MSLLLPICWGAFPYCFVLILPEHKHYGLRCRCCYSCHRNGRKTITPTTTHQPNHPSGVDVLTVHKSSRLVSGTFLVRHSIEIRTPPSTAKPVQGRRVVGSRNVYKHPITTKTTHHPPPPGEMGPGTYSVLPSKKLPLPCRHTHTHTHALRPRLLQINKTFFDSFPNPLRHPLFRSGLLPLH